jgi:hypothetical protein
MDIIKTTEKYKSGLTGATAYHKDQERQHFVRTMTDRNHTVIPQEVSMSSVSSTLGLLSSVAGTIQDQRASVANAKQLTPFQEKKQKSSSL